MTYYYSTSVRKCDRIMVSIGNCINLLVSHVTHNNLRRGRKSWPDLTQLSFIFVSEHSCYGLSSCHLMVQGDFLSSSHPVHIPGKIKRESRKKKRKKEKGLYFIKDPSPKTQTENLSSTFHWREVNPWHHSVARKVRNNSFFSYLYCHFTKYNRGYVIKKN